MVNRWGLVGVAALAVAAFWGVWTYGFASDDVALVRRLVEQGWGGIAPFLTPATGALGKGGYLAYYRPAWVLLTAADYALWGTWPGGYHLTNVLLFALSAALVWQLVSDVTGDRRAAWWAGALFALHPIHTVSVIWISGRTDGIATLGILAALCANVRWRQSGRRRWLLLALLAGLLALGGKETGYMLPPIVIATEWARLRAANGANPVRHALRASVPFWSLVMLWAGVVLSSGTFVTQFAWSVSLRAAVTNLAGALVLLVWPFDYEPLVRFFVGRMELLLGAAVCTAVGAAAFVWWSRKHVALLWGMLWTGLGIALCYRLTMRWYLLLASVGVCVVLALLVRLAEQRARGRAGVLIGVGLLVLFATGLAQERVKWAQADAFGQSALQSLVALAQREPVPESFILVTSPFKVRRMPVFGGNAESFLRVAGVRSCQVHVLSHASLDRADARVHLVWTDSTRLTLCMPPGDGMFMVAPDHRALTSRGRMPLGYRAPTELGTVAVQALDDDHRPVALEVTLDAPHPSARWVALSGRRFVHVEPQR